MEDKARPGAPNRGMYEAIVLWRNEVIDRAGTEMEFAPQARTAEAFVTALLERLEAEAVSGDRTVLDTWLGSLASLEALADYAALVDFTMANLIALSGLLAPRSLGRGLLLRRDALQAVIASAAPATYNDPALAAARAVHAMVQNYDAHYGKHSQGTSDLAVRLGEALLLSPADVGRLRLAGLVHDAGMVTVPSAVLERNSELSPEEWDAIRRHPEIGARMIEELPLLSDTAPAVRSHHERFDGAGYPDGLSGDQIPLFARILAVADAYEALTSSRPHRPALGRETALGAIGGGRGSQWDPVIVDVLMTMMRLRGSSAERRVNRARSCAERGLCCRRSGPGAFASVGQWSTAAPLPEPRQAFGIAAAGGRVYVLGGYSARGQRLNEMYDVAQGRWEERAPLPAALNYPAAASVGEKSTLSEASPSRSGSFRDADRAAPTATIRRPTVGIASPRCRPGARDSPLSNAAGSSMRSAAAPTSISIETSGTIRSATLGNRSRRCRRRASSWPEGFCAAIFT